MKTETTPETQETKSNQNKSRDKKERRPRAWLWFVLYGLLVLVGLSIGSWYFEKGADRAKFWVEGLLSAAVLSVVAIQAYIYREQWHVMGEQLRAMRGSLEETQKAVAQNERAVEAAEQSARVAEQSFYASERPHFGIIKMALSRPLRAGDRPFVDISWMNGGKTPAWHFYAIVGLSLNEGSPDYDPDAEIWTLRHPIGDLSKSFFPEGEQKVIRYQATHKWTQTNIDAIVAETKRLFIRGKAHWRDTRGESQDWTFRVVYFPATEEFGDYDT